MAKGTSPESAALGRRLRAERERRGWGRRTMARHLLDHIDDRQKPSHVTVAGYIKNWENGEVRITDPRYRSAYAAVLNIPEDELFGEIPQSGLPSSGTLTGSVDFGVIPDEGGDDVKRRAALQLLAALGAGTAIPPGALEEVLAGVDAATGGPVDLDAWNATVRDYAFQINRTPIGAYLDDLIADVISVGRLLERQPSEPLRTGLLQVSAGLSAMLAIELGDVGNRRGARMTWSTARRAADASGDRGLMVWVRARQAEEGLWSGASPVGIRELLAEAIEIADGTPCSGLPRAHAIRACLAAEAGNVAVARQEMNTLTTVFERLPESVTTDPGTFGWGASRLRWNEAYVYTLTGDDRGPEAADEAIALYPPGTLGPVANLRMIQAMGLVRQREIDAGLEASVGVLHQLPVSPTRRHMAGRILRQLPGQAHALPAARELRALTAGA
ncbi:XRE family transcriptional regulator [Thermomonospora cellulosilytica]|uniref:Transcriptional regulator with XRE-family HTH domain n=1 Tax=Thermomonospora cellulosilytica TaxID=1411118 RepID=A0A7W3MUN1_9ACTN|nr:XRE family transcriptional regulator [Thermomonospora cellulosilytica]MBA9002247.1 transcriptional regulator with XRE-family HTH domain [Thermomonospora cellulosilytica]